VASTVIEKMLSYALGRHLHAHDMSAVRKIAAETSGSDYRFSDIVMRIVESDPFRLKIAETPDTDVAGR